ncbi:hypothetical protein X977_5039 [Burkholderia pseudomallei MSHR7504]|nr:hypothetical protein X977_5039 [Burkholderia pseudomallei MSHR7504]
MRKSHSSPSSANAVSNAVRMYRHALSCGCAEPEKSICAISSSTSDRTRCRTEPPSLTSIARRESFALTTSLTTDVSNASSNVPSIRRIAPRM